MSKKLSAPFKADKCKEKERISTLVARLVKKMP